MDVSTTGRDKEKWVKEERKDDKETAFLDQLEWPGLE
jgi:hypothetical protein